MLNFLSLNSPGRGAVAVRPRLGRWSRRAGLLSLSALLACQGGGSPATTGAPANPAGAPAGAGPDLVFTIDGKPANGPQGTLYNRPREGFALDLKAESGVNYSGADITVSMERPLAVGQYSIADTIASNAQNVTVTALLPQFAHDSWEREGQPFSSHVGNSYRGLADFPVYDWGSGPHLAGREVGRLVFTRVTPTTVDGSFYSSVYVLAAKREMVQYQGQRRELNRLKGHLLKATFRNLPLVDFSQTPRKP